MPSSTKSERNACAGPAAQRTMARIDNLLAVLDLLSLKPRRTQELPPLLGVGKSRLEGYMTALRNEDVVSRKLVTANQMLYSLHPNTERVELYRKKLKGLRMAARDKLRGRSLPVEERTEAEEAMDMVFQLWNGVKKGA